MKKILFIWLLLFSALLQAQYTLIPDSYFEGYLVNAGIDTDGEVNGQVLTSDIADETQLTITGNIFITDLTGIEDFESLNVLDIGQMGITEIDLLQNINLEYISISDVSLESLDLSANINLTFLGLGLHPDAGMFTSSITSIDLSNNILLSNLIIGHSLITEVDLSNNPNINHLDLNFMQELTFVNIKSGANWDIGLLEVHDNPNLQCLQVDDPQAVIEGVIPPYDNWIIENNPLLTITDDCNLGLSEYLTSKVNIYPNPAQNILNINSDIFINSVQVYDVLGRLVLQENNPTNQLDVSKISNGLLFVKLETDIGIITKKIIKE